MDGESAKRIRLEKLKKVEKCHEHKKFDMGGLQERKGGGED